MHNHTLKRIYILLIKGLTNNILLAIIYIEKERNGKKYEKE